MSLDPHLAPLTETITIGATPHGGLTAHGWNGGHRVLLAESDGSNHWLTRDGANLRECYGSVPGPGRGWVCAVKADDVLDLLAAGKCGEFEVEVRATRPAARRDCDFGVAA